MGFDVGFCFGFRGLGFRALMVLGVYGFMVLGSRVWGSGGFR